MPGPAATIGSMHICPMMNPGTPPPPHVGGPVSGPGVPTVLIGGKPAAVMGDLCTCSGPPDTISQGEATVLIGGKPAATMGSMTAHGGSITVGEPTVLIGTGAGAATAVQPVKQIPFPKITALLKTMAVLTGRSPKLNEAIANQEELKKQAENTEQEPRIYNLRWEKEKYSIKNSKVLKEVTLSASVSNADDGESVSFSVERTNRDGSIEQVKLTGQVDKGKVSVNWEIEEKDNQSKSTS